MSLRPPARTGGDSGLRAVAVAVVCLALAAVLFLVWRSANADTITSPQASAARTSAPSAQASSTATAPAKAATKDPVTGLSWIEESALPAPAKRVLAQIDKGGPYDYDKDGTTFRNAEGLLPKQANGFYREYTVVLPGSNDRGPVRIIVGGKGEQYFWTTDHYASFSRIRR